MMRITVSSHTGVTQSYSQKYKSSRDNADWVMSHAEVQRPGVLRR